MSKYETNFIVVALLIAFCVGSLIIGYMNSGMVSKVEAQNIYVKECPVCKQIGYPSAIRFSENGKSVIPDVQLGYCNNCGAVFVVK